MNATDYALIIEGSIGVAIAIIIALTIITLTRINAKGK